MDSKKLERYLETKYALEDRNYEVRCDTGNDFFHVAVRHLEEEEPNAEGLANDILETLYLNEERWSVDTDEGRDQTFLYAEKESLFDYSA